ncbi:MAG TPA: MFS transporter [Stellaceae bacterium]
MADKEFTSGSVAAATASALALMAGASVVVHGTFGVFLVPLTKEFGWSRAEISAGLAVWSWVQALMIPVIGHLMDRFGVRAFMLGGLLLLAATMVGLSAQNGSLYMLLGLFAVIGLCSSFGGFVGNAKLVSGWFSGRRGLVLALVAMGTGIAGGLIPQWTGLSVTLFGWRTAYLVIAGYVLVLTVPVFLFLRESPAVLAARARGEALSKSDATGMSVREASRYVSFWLCLGALVLNTALLGLNLHMVPLLIDRGLTPQTAATVLSAQVFGSTIIYLVAGYLLDKISTPKLALFFSLCALGGLVMIHLGSGFGTLLIAGTLIGAGTTGEGSVVPYFLTRYFGLKAFASIYGLMWGVAAVANGIQPVILGRIFDTTGSYSWGLLYCEACVFLVAMCFFALPRYRFAARLPQHETPAEPLAEGVGEIQSQGA